MNRLHKLGIHFKTGLLAGLVAGAVLGILEAVVIIFTRPHLPEKWVLFYAPVLYGLIYTCIGAGLGFAVGIWSPLFWAKSSSSRSYSTYFSLIFSLFCLISTRFPGIGYQLPSNIPALLAFVIYFVILFFLLRIVTLYLLKKTALQGLLLSDTSTAYFLLLMVIASLIAGLLLGITLGILSIILVVLFTTDLSQIGVLLLSPIYFGLIYSIIGLLFGLIVGILRILFGVTPSSSRGYTIYWSFIFCLFAFITTRFRIMRDVLMEKPFPRPQQLLLLLAFLILFLLARILLGRLLEKTTYRRLTGFAGSVGVYVVMVLLAALVAVGIWLASPSEKTSIPETIPIALRNKPNVILIMVDALRADRLNCYGYRPRTSPNIDALAADAIRFETCITQSSWTRPSTATLFTALYPSSHQAIFKPDMLPEPVVSLAELMTAGGYFALGFANNVNIAPIFNFGQGFDQYIFLKPHYFFKSPESGFQLAGYNQLRLIRERFFSKAKHVYHYYQDAQVVNKNVLSWLEKVQNSRFFLFVHYMETHDPYFVHPYNNVGYARVSNPNPNPSVAGLFSDTYDGELRFVDQALGELWRWLKDHGLYQDALIVLTSDHGQEFYEHGGWWHGTTLYEEQIHVPLVVKLPGQKEAGTVDQRVVRTLDIAPTILALTDISSHPSMQGQSFLGTEGKSWTGVEDVFSEEDHEGNVVLSLRTRNFKLIQANPNNPRGLPPVAVFNLTEDPWEKNNLAQEQSELVDVMQPRLEEKLALAQGGAVARQEREIDEATQERLKSLGYTE